jgi:hypothetical protein
MNTILYNSCFKKLLHSKQIFFITFFFVNIFLAEAQKTSKLLLSAEECMLKEDYLNANNYWKLLVTRDSLNIKYLHNYAYTSYKIYDLYNAERYFKITILNDSKKQFKDDAYYLAQTLKMLSKYSEAKKEFEKYYRRNRKNNNLFSAQCLNEIEGCNIALQNKGVKIKVQLLDTTINTILAENAGFLYGNTLYFSTKSDSNHYSIFKSERLNNSFLSKQSVEEINSNKSNTSNLFIDDTTAYFTIFNDSGNAKSCNLFEAKYKNGIFLNIKMLDEKINRIGTVNTQAHAAYLGNTKYLFFVSNRSETLGGMDIFISKINLNGSFETPINIGKNINSTGDEITPFFCNHCQTLFFSSNYFPGFGGFDIFKSNYYNGEFSMPENIGKPFNSSLNDIYFSYYHDQEIAFLSSNRKGSRFNRNEYCCNDIYRINFNDSSKQIIDVKDTIINSKIDSFSIKINSIKKYLPMQLYFDNDEPDNKTNAITTEKTYSETVEKYIANEKNYLKYYLKGANKKGIEDSQLQLNQFFEDSIKNTLTKLVTCSDIILDLLNSGKIIKIIVKGYCSPLASTEYNKNLAKRRINSLVNELKKNKQEAFVKYIESKKLIIEEVEIGELAASEFTSDNPNDIKNSVYSLKAALERKISILEVIVN